MIVIGRVILGIPRERIQDLESESLILSNASAIYRLCDVGKSLSVSEPQLLYLQNGNNIIFPTYLIVMLGDLNKVSEIMFRF